MKRYNYLIFAILLCGCASYEQIQLLKKVQENHERNRTYAQNPVSNPLINKTSFLPLPVFYKNMTDVEEYASTRIFQVAENKSVIKGLHRQGNFVFLTGYSASSPRYIAAEVALNWQYWMTNEATRLYKERFKDRNIKTLLNTNNEDKFFPIVLEPYIHSKLDVIEHFMKEIDPDISESLIKSSQKRCVLLVGYSNISWKTKQEKKDFYKKCYYDIVNSFEGEKQQKAMNILYKRLGKTYDYSPLSIKEHIVYTDGDYDAKFIAHTQGTYGNLIRKNLLTPKENRVLVKFTTLVDDDSLFKQDYFYLALNPIGFNAYMLKYLFKVPYAERFYDDYRTLKLSLQNRSLEPFEIGGYKRTLLRKMNANCNIVNDYIHLAIESSVTRIVFDCKHDPIVMPKEKFDKEKEKGLHPDFEHHNHYVGTMQRYRKFNAAEAYELDYLADSKMTYLNFDEASIEKYTGAFHNTTLLTFDFEKTGIVSSKAYPNFPWENQRGLAKNISHQALFLLEKLPPNAMVSWIAYSSDKATKIKEIKPSFLTYSSNDTIKQKALQEEKRKNNKSSYVYHHGVLWEFPLRDFRDLGLDL